MQPSIKLTLPPLLRRATVAIPLLGAFLLVMLGASLAGGAAPNRASVVIQAGAETRLVRAIDFTAPISGLRALELTGIAVVTRSFSFGDAVCSIDGVGCPAEDCFCSSNYWSYWYWGGAGWQEYAVSAGNSVISQTGAVEGWRWGQYGDTLAPADTSLQALAAFDWLAPRQTITGDFGGLGATVETVLALGANRQRNASATAWLGATGAAYTHSSPAAAGKLAVALAGADGCLPAGAITPAGHFSATLGAYSAQSGANAWAILGAAALSETIPAVAVASLAAQIQPDGGWEWAPGWGADTNATSLALQALVAAGEPLTASTVISGLGYLESVQLADGGFPYAGGATAASDANSTAYVVQTLVAVGEAPRAPRWNRSGGNPFDYLAARQLADGSFEWQAGTGANLLATQQAIPALLGRPFPVQREAIPVCPALYLPLMLRD